jgi:hypothetical protein
MADAILTRAESADHLRCRAVLTLRHDRLGGLVDDAVVMK